MLYILFIFFLLTCHLTSVGSDRRTVDSPRHNSKMSKCRQKTPFFKNGPRAACNLKETNLSIGRCCCHLLLCLHLWCHRSVGFVMGETDGPSPSNKSFLPTEQCLQDQGEVQGKGKCLSSASRYQPNRKRCLPLRAVMMRMIMFVCVCVYGYKLSVVLNLCVCLCVHINFLHFYVCLHESGNVWQSNLLRPGRCVMKNTFAKCAQKLCKQKEIAKNIATLPSSTVCLHNACRQTDI